MGLIGPMGPMRHTILLTERKPRRVRLAPADVVFLQTTHRNRIDLAPTGRRGVFLLTPRGCAGVIVAPTRRLVIHPKIPLQNLFCLLDPDDPDLHRSRRTRAGARIGDS